jgi:hypothetical protein
LSVVPARVGGGRRAMARLVPVVLPASAQVRLRRLAPGAEWRENLSQLVVPLDPKEPAAESLRDLLRALLPLAAAA